MWLKKIQETGKTRRLGTIPSYFMANRRLPAGKHLGPNTRQLGVAAGHHPLDP